MAVTSSGEIRISDVLTEVGLSTTLANTSLGNLEGGSVFTINTNSPAKPNGSAPNSLSEWYSYDHSATASFTNGYYQLSGNNDSNRGGRNSASAGVFTIDGTQDLSFAGWWRFDATHTGSTTAKQFMGIGIDGNNQIFFQNRGSEIRFRLRFSGNFHEARYFLHQSGNDTPSGITSNAAINATNRGNVNADGFVHLAFTYDASQDSPANSLKVYWNGTLLTQTSTPNSLTAALRNNNTYNADVVTIGGIRSNVNATNAHIGGIDNLVIYKTLLSSTNVTSLYNSGTSISATDAGVTTGLDGEWTNETDDTDSQGSWDTLYTNGAARTAY
tara:strand:+ start:748 stop:1734 length:987 start_codon:yes stop_codon:yes gene_type:complete